MKEISYFKVVFLFFQPNSALDQFKVENVQDEIAEIEYLWDMMTKSIAHFEDYLNHKSVITEELASHFYSNSFLKVKDLIFKGV